MDSDCFVFASQRRDIEESVCTHVQTDVGSSAGGVLHLRCCLHLCICGNRKLTGLRILESRLAICDSGADSWLDWRGAVRQQHVDERHVRSDSGSDRQIAWIACPAGADLEL